MTEWWLARTRPCTGGTYVFVADCCVVAGVQAISMLGRHPMDMHVGRPWTAALGWWQSAGVNLSYYSSPDNALEGGLVTGDKPRGPTVSCRAGYCETWLLKQYLARVDQ